MKLAVVIPSRRRADRLAAGALTLMPDAVVCVGADEVAAYKRVTKRLLVHPADVTGIGPLRQWIRTHVKEDVVFMLDDDADRFYTLVGAHARRIHKPDEILEVVTQVAICAKESGARIFGFNQAWDVRKFTPHRPISFSGWVGGAIGVIGKDVAFDPALRLRADIDACLASLLKHRIIYQDLRFAFAHRRFEGAGGNAVSRSHAAHEREIAYLRKKWGGHLRVRQTKDAIRLIVDVERTR